MTTKKLLVVGATGKQGGALISALLSDKSTPSKYSIYGLTRNVSSPSSLKLARQNVSMVSGDVTSPISIFEKVGKDIWGVFSMTNVGKNEEQEAKPLIDAAITSGVKHFIYTSVDRGGPTKSDTDPTYVPHFMTKFNVEKYLIEKAAQSPQRMTWTILRPVAFMDNLGPDFAGKSMARIMERMGSVRLLLISSKDIGRVAAKAFSEPEKFAGQALSLAGDSLTYQEMSKIFKEETGKDFPLAPGLVVTAFLYFNEDMGKMVRWINGGGYGDMVDEDMKKELGLMNFRTWLKEESLWPTKA